MKRIAPLFVVCLLGLIVLTAFAPEARARSRLKDIVTFQGIRSNQLIGYGLVVGLNGTGDNLSGSPFTKESIISMMERMGVNVRGNTISSKNVAAVIVTANLPPFARPGTTIDVQLSSIGDAKNLTGGILLVTPLMGADGQVYAVGQGPITVGGFSAGGAAGGNLNQGSQNITRGVPTSGRVANGATVEKDVAFDINGLQQVTLSLNNPDVTTARRVAEVINNKMGAPVAGASSPSTIDIIVPPSFRGNVVGLIATIEHLEVTPDQPAKIVVSEDTGVIVMGDQVRISSVAVAHGNLTIRVTDTPEVSQPNDFSFGAGATTEVVRQQTVDVQEENSKLTVLNTGANLHDLVKALNTLGVGPRDIISILQAIKAAGALQADIEVI